MLEVKCDKDNCKLSIIEVQSTYPGFLFDHLAELLAYERNRERERRMRKKDRRRRIGEGRGRD